MDTLVNESTMGTIRTSLNANFTELVADIAERPTQTSIDAALALKVDKDEDKILSDNNFSDDNVANLSTAYNHSQVAHAAANALVPADVVNNLTSDDAAVPLSAAQGKALNLAKVAIDLTGTATADAAHRGTFRVTTSGDVDTLEVCLATGVGTYAWTTVVAGV